VDSSKARDTAVQRNRSVMEKKFLQFKESEQKFESVSSKFRIKYLKTEQILELGSENHN
jgi:hypothetical protein